MGVASFAELQPIEDDMGRKVRSVNDTGQAVSASDHALMAAYVAKSSLGLPVLAVEYLERRFGVDEAQAELLGIGFDDGSISYDAVGRLYHATPRLVVPFRDFDGVLRGFQSRSLRESTAKWAGPTNPEVGTWAKFAFFDNGQALEYLVVAEGPGDALTAAAAGFDAVGIRGASMAGSVAASIVAAGVTVPVVLAGDRDDAGAMFNAALAGPLVDAGLDVHILGVPSDVKDLTEWHEARPAEFLAEFQAAVAAAHLHVRPRAEAEAAEGEKDIARALALESRRDLLSDEGLAIFLRGAFAGDVLHSPGLGFFLYEAGVWKLDDMARIRVWAHEAADALRDDASDVYAETMRGFAMASQLPSVEDEAEALAVLTAAHKAARRLRSAGPLDQVLKELAALLNVEADTFDREHHLLAARNGTIDLRTGTLGPHCREDRLTKQLAINFDPDAEAPRWGSFLEEAFTESTDQMVTYLQRLIGYGITGETSEQCFAVLWGRGANGKSVFTDTLSHVFEALTETTPFDTFEAKQSGGIPNDIAALRGARLVMASEGEQGKPMAESVMKRVTGQDLLSARFMRQEFFSFRPTFLILLATNHKPSFRGQDEGLWRRVKLIPWARYFAPAERDHYLTAKLRLEAEGILAWAVRGAVAWRESGLLDPPLVVAAVKGYREVSDALAEFFPGVLVADSSSYILGSEAYQLYLEWADENGLGGRAWSRQALYAAMEERGAVRVSIDRGIRLAGVRKADPEGDAPAYTSLESKDSIF